MEVPVPTDISSRLHRGCYLLLGGDDDVIINVNIIHFLHYIFLTASTPPRRRLRVRLPLHAATAVCQLQGTFSFSRAAQLKVSFCHTPECCWFVYRFVLWHLESETVKLMAPRDKNTFSVWLKTRNARLKCLLVFSVPCRNFPGWSANSRIDRYAALPRVFVS